MLKCLQNLVEGPRRAPHVYVQQRGGLCAIPNRNDLQGCQALTVRADAGSMEGIAHTGHSAFMPIANPCRFAGIFGILAFGWWLPGKLHQSSRMRQEQALASFPDLGPTWCCVCFICKQQPTRPRQSGLRGCIGKSCPAHVRCFLCISHGLALYHCLNACCHPCQT